MNNIIEKELEQEEFYPIVVESSISRAKELEEEYQKSETTLRDDNLPLGYKINSDGVWFEEPQKDESAPVLIRICSKLEITAITRDHNNENHGRLLEFTDCDGIKHE